MFVYILGGIKEIVSLKKKSSTGLKVLFALGGSNQDPSIFSELFANKTSTTKFIDSCLAFIRKHGFDGINIDWHFPREDVERNDTKNYVTALTSMKYEFKHAPESINEELLLTITIPGKPSNMKGFDIPELNKLVHFYTVTSYNYHTSDERSAHHHSPLFNNKKGTACNDNLNLDINSTVHTYIQKGINKTKVIIGIPLFGTCHKLEGKDNFGDIWSLLKI